MFLLVDDHGTVLGKYRDRHSAVAAWEKLSEEDPLAADECAVIELDAHGKRVGDPITPVSA